jgi:hypothetical protein
MRRLTAVPIAWALCAAPAYAHAGATLAGQHAVYTLSLASSHAQDVIAASGTMTYDLADACGGWTTAQHLVINMTNNDGKDVHMVSDYATYETKDGTKLNFHSRQTTGDAVTLDLDGTAQLDKSGGHGHADFSNPEKKRIPLPEGTLLPNSHTIAIISAGMAGKRFLSMPLFDGTAADGAQDTFVTIEHLNKPHTEKWSALSALPSTRVHVAFFERSATTQTPDYEIGMRYFDNGVADELSMNFGDFVMDGALVQLTLRPQPRC